jgi:hypothetical protein
MSEEQKKEVIEFEVVNFHGAGIDICWLLRLFCFIASITAGRNGRHRR